MSKKDGLGLRKPERKQRAEEFFGGTDTDSTKSTQDDRRQHTVYLEAGMSKAMRMYAAMNETHFSGAVEEAVKRLIQDEGLERFMTD